MTSPAPAALPGSWTFYADASVAPYTPFGMVTVTGFSATSALSDYGTGQAIIPVDSNALGRADLLRFYSYRLWALYRGVPVWAGLGTGLLDEGGSAVQVSLTELPGYLLRKQYVNAVTYSGAEQTMAAADLAQRLDNIGVPRIIDPGPGRTRTIAYGYLDGQSRGDLLTQLAQMSGGPQFRAEYAAEAVTGRPGCTLRIAYPRVGIAGAVSGLALVVPGGAASFQATWTTDELRNRTFAVGDLPDGAATGTKRPVQTNIISQPGIPVLDAADDWPGVTSLNQLQDLAATNATLYASPTLTLAAVMPISDPPLGSYAVGDDVSVVLADPLIPSGYVASGQLARADIDAAAGTVTWTVSVTSPSQRRRSLLGRLGAAEGRLAAMFHNQMPTPPTGIEQ